MRGRRRLIAFLLGAVLLASLRQTVAVVERDGPPGGAPVNRGGISTNTLRETALYLTGSVAGRSTEWELGLTPVRLGAPPGSDGTGVVTRQGAAGHR